MYILFVGTTLSPDLQPVFVKAFGAQPFGFPVTLVVAIGMAVLLLPFAFAVHHFMLIAEQAARDGHSVGSVGLLVYAAGVGQRHPELRGSQRIATAGLIYFVIVCGIWIAYADAKGV